MQPSPANALLQGSSDRHQIGRNGSFWLPPKSSFEGKTDFSKDLKEKNQINHLNERPSQSTIEVEAEEIK